MTSHDIAFEIVVTNDPHENDWPWRADIRKPGGALISVRLAETRAGVIESAREWIRVERHGREPSETLRATDDGELIYGESLRAVRPDDAA